MIGNLTVSEIRTALRARGFDLETMLQEFRELEQRPPEEMSEAELETKFNVLIQQLNCLTAPGKSQ